MKLRNLAQGAAAAAVLSTQLVTAAFAATGAAQAVPAAAEQQEDYCGRSLGTWFYCERPVRAPAAKGQQAPAPPPAPATEAQEMEAFQKALEEAQATAVWDPRPENIRRYYELQEVALSKATLFQDNWKRMIWENPELDYTLKRPVSTLGKRVWQDDREGDRDLFLRGVSEHVGLFYIFRGDCSNCRVASPIVKSFSVRYGVPVTAVSGDGAGNAHFEKVVRDQGQLQAWGVGPITPALMIFQKPDAIVGGKLQQTQVRLAGNRTVKLRSCRQAKGCLTYIGAGVMSVDDIAERLFVLLAFEPGQDY